MAPRRALRAVAPMLSGACLIGTVAACGATDRPAGAGPGCGDALPECVALTDEACAMIGDNARRAPCPDDRPHRAEVPSAVVCSSRAGAPSGEHCALLPRGCAPEARAALAPLADELRDAGWTARECTEGLWAGSVGLLRRGERPPIDIEEVRGRLGELEGILGVGLGLCCAFEGTNEPCPRVYFDGRETTAEEMAAAIARATPDPDVGAAYHLEDRAVHHPRCASQSPLCLPEPYDECMRSAYDARAERRPTELGENSGACAHDGECVASGCGNECRSYGESGQVGTCIYYATSRPVFCGCVAGACTWFTH